MRARLPAPSVCSLPLGYMAMAFSQSPEFLQNGASALSVTLSRVPLHWAGHPVTLPRLFVLPHPAGVPLSQLPGGRFKVAVSTAWCLPLV